MPSPSRLYPWIFILAGASVLLAADDQRLALLTQAEAAFDRVQLAPEPQLHDTAACVLSQAALLPVTAPDDVAVIHFRKGYCTLSGAAITRNAAEFNDAAAQFEQAIAAWPLHPVAKNRPSEPLPTVLRILTSVSRLHAGADDPATERATNDIREAVANPVCSTTLLPAAYCHAYVRTGKQWLGWLALRRGDLRAAAADFADSPGSGWPEWVAARQLFEAGNYREAAVRYRLAFDLLHVDTLRLLPDRLGPPADRASELAEWGGAQVAAGDAAAAISTLDAAVKADPSNAHAIYLRAAAKESAGQKEAALADYNLASRTAFANAKDLASGEAHLYRGIILYRRKDYPHAENEFASALNFTITPAMRADAEAWRHLSAVASGACEASRQYLERSMASVSPFFPKQEARGVMASCTAAVSAAGQAAGAADK